MSAGTGADRDEAASRLRRRGARLASVQALYQIELSGRPADAVIEEFLHHRVGRDLDGARFARPHRRHFEHTVREASARAREIDALVADSLAERWNLERLGAVLRALMRAAVCELFTCPEVPARVVIDEYVELARAFFSGREPAFVNGALDTLARRLRAVEMAEATEDDEPPSGE